MATILKGSDVVAALDQQIIKEVAALGKKGIVPTLAIVRLGQRSDDLSYERGAWKRAKEVGVGVRQVVLPVDVSEALLLETIEALNADNLIHGVLLLRPLPPHINDEKVRNVLAARKDVDGIGNQSLAGVLSGSAIGYAPCTAQACMEILRHYQIELEGKRAVVIGRSLVVGKPVALLLLGQDATVTLCHSRTVDLPLIVRSAQIVISCMGCAQMVDASYLSAGQVVIDVGTNITDSGVLVGDVNFDAAQAIVSALTPVPGGVGTVTTSILMKHVVTAACDLSSTR